jgi:hypothetical protein
MYTALAKDLPPGGPLVACHLRAEPIMRPGVPERLTVLLSDMHDELDHLVQQGEL